MILTKKQTGFTVVETLMVMSVMGVLFIATATLIRGQTERYRYEDSMRQLQQIVQSAINDVSNGYLSSTSGNSTNEYLVGKRFWFCADTASVPVIPECATGGNGSIMYLDSIHKIIGNANLNFVRLSTVSTPNDIKFIYFKSLNASGGAPAGEGSKEFGSAVLMTDENGDISTDTNGFANVTMYSRSGSSKLASASPYGFILCFQGKYKGSLELGSAKSGTTAYVNYIDPRCD